MTIIRYRPDPGSTETVLETARDPLEVIDWVRQRWHGDLPKSDPAFEAARQIAAKPKDQSGRGRAR